MKSRISQTTLRDRLAVTLDGVSRGDEFIIERRGKPLAALISAAKFDVMRRAARRRALVALEQQKGGPLTDAEATKLALSAQRWARKERLKVRRRAT